MFVLISILAALVVPSFSGRTEQARVAAARAQLTVFNSALSAFEVDYGYYPKSRTGLSDLLVQSRDAQSSKGPYIKNEIPNDPWGHPYVYECPGKHNPTSYDLMSVGPDGRAGNEDDIASWNLKK